MSWPASDGRAYGVGPLARRESVRPGGKPDVCGLGAVASATSPARFGCWSAGVLERWPSPVIGAYASDSFPTRLETRTKESNMRASRWEQYAKPGGAVKAGRTTRLWEDALGFLLGPHSRGASATAAGAL